MSRTCNTFALTVVLALATSAAVAQPVDDLRTGYPADARIVLATFYGELLPGFRAIRSDFEKETGIGLVVQAVPYQSHQMWLRTQILGRQPPELLLLEHNSAELYGPTGNLLSLDERIARPNPLRPEAGAWGRAFRVPMVQQARDVEGDLWMAPYLMFGVGFFYNKDLFDKHAVGVPATFDDFVSVCRTIEAGGDTAMCVAVKPRDAQSIWMSNLLLECLMRRHIPAVNFEHAPGWVFRPEDRTSTLDERISLTERIVAFEKGLIDPRQAPEFDAVARLMFEFSRTWDPAMLSIDPSEIYQAFSRGDTSCFMNGTWFFGTLISDQELMREVSPNRVFDYGTFPFPELTDASTELPRIGGINQNAGFRAGFLVPRQPRAEWRERAGLLLCYYLTMPRVARKVFAHSQSWDICALEEVPPKPEADALLPRSRYAYLPVASFTGYDAQSTGEFWPLWQRFLGGTIDRAEFIETLGELHRESLVRQAIVYADRLDAERIERELGRAFP